MEAYIHVHPVHQMKMFPRHGFSAHSNPAFKIHPHLPTFLNIFPKSHCPSLSLSAFVATYFANSCVSKFFFLLVSLHKHLSLFSFLTSSFHLCSHPLTLPKWPQDVAAVHLHLLTSQVHTQPRKPWRKCSQRLVRKQGRGWLRTLL